MGKLNHGPFGSYSGKIGNLVFYQNNDENIVRTIGRNTNPATIAQLNGRQEMAVATAFIQSILSFINVGFKTVAAKAKRYPFHIAVSYHKKHALKGIYPNIEMDFTKVKISEGDLPAAQQADVSMTTEGLLFSWFTDPANPQQSDLDQVMLMAYFSESGEAIFLLAGATRSVGQAILPIPMEMQTSRVETYISFITQDRMQVANSVYVKSIP